MGLAEVQGVQMPINGVSIDWEAGQVSPPIVIRYHQHKLMVSSFREWLFIPVWVMTLPNLFYSPSATKAVCNWCHTSDLSSKASTLQINLPKALTHYSCCYLNHGWKACGHKCHKEVGGLISSSSPLIIFFPTKKGGLALPSLVMLYKRLLK